MDLLAINALFDISAKRAANRGIEFSPEQFLKLLLTQLRMQDPLSVSDNVTDMIQPLGMLGSIMQTEKLRREIERMNALLMLGVNVTAIIDGKAVNGQVVAASLTDEPTLSVQVGDSDFVVSLSDVVQVRGNDAYLRLSSWAQQKLPRR